MSTGMYYRAMSLIELCQSIDYCTENSGQAYLYLHDGRWVVSPKPCNDMADDHVGDWKRVSKADKARQHMDIDRKAIDAMRAEVT